MVASSRSRTRADAAAEKRTTRSAAAASSASHNDENLSISGRLVLASSPSASSSKATAVASKQRLPSSAKKAQTQSKPVASTGGDVQVPVTPLRKVRSNLKNEDVVDNKQTFCLCHGPDDGSPMVKCDGDCNSWFHFRCVDISEEEAGEIDAFFCPFCEAKLGVKSIRNWEGPEAFVDLSNTVMPGPMKLPKTQKKVKVLRDMPADEESDESEDGSEDDYMETEGRTKLSGKNNTSRLSFATEPSASDSDSDHDRPKRISRRSVASAKAPSSKISKQSPILDDTAALKRRGSLLATSSSKKARTTSTTPSGDDPMRKFCLAKLSEIIRPIFVEYRETEKKAFASTTPQNPIEGDVEPETPNLQLTEDEKREIDDSVSTFVSQLEACMMDEYAENDKNGKPTAGGKYKERFRMLSFNLGKDDRILLRKGIASGRITPSQLNTMSSNDLANEQTKAEIEAFEQEALQHSIMKKMQAPSAKMTHKGIEMIEENIQDARNQEERRIEEEEDRIENERRERERVARERQRSLSMALPSTPVDTNAPVSAVPHSPVVQTLLGGAWGMPPPFPLPAGQPPSPLVPQRPPQQPLFVPSDSDFGLSMEGELELADLINIDDDLPQDTGGRAGSPPLMTPQPISDGGSVNNSTPEVVTPSGPSPFAQSKPLSPHRRTSFDLNSLWTADNASAMEPQQNVEADKKLQPATEDGDEGEAMDIDSGDEMSEDRMLDAILDESPAPAPIDSESQPEPPSPTKVRIDLLPNVWTGTLAMPYDSTTTLGSSVIAKQIGGRSFVHTSSAWSTLFPKPEARIDGRVPVPKSSEYLIEMRLNATRELLAVCLQPASDEHISQFNRIFDFLVNKSRHGLVFPWGTHPKREDPGRELYIIPLKKDEPIPEYIELLDNVKLPKERPSNLIVGVFVLSKGKLKESTTTTTTTTTTTPPPTAPQHALAAPPPPPAVPSPPVPQAQPPLTSLLTGLPRVQGVDHAALAAEVASLTPEQISLMLRTLGQAASAPGPTQFPGIPPPTSLNMVNAPAPLLPPPHPLVMPPFAPNLSYAASQMSPLGHSPTRPPLSSPRDGYDNRHDWRPYDKEEERRGRLGRGQRRPQGRGRPHGDDREQFKRESDSGWRGRGRG